MRYNAAGMIVGQHDSSRFAANGRIEHLAWIHEYGVERALRDDFHADHSAACVHKNDLEILDSIKPVGFAQKIRHPLRRIEYRRRAVSFRSEEHTSELQSLR